LLVFLFIPAVWAVLMSVAPPQGAGSLVSVLLYLITLTSGLFWRAVLNTMYFGIFYVPGSLIAGYVLALLLVRVGRGRSCLLLLFFLPALLPPTAAGVLWKWLYDPGSGLVADVSLALGFWPVSWLSEARLVHPSIAIMCVWQSAGLVAAIFLIALKAVPQEYHDMAEVDGARGWRRLVYVSIPTVQDAVVVCVLLLLINTLRVFGPIFVMTGDGGPANWSTTLPFLVYRTGLTRGFDFNGACALSTMLCFAVAILVVLLRTRRLRGGQIQ
jgi:multiple sugar transport system permease protein